MGLLGLRKVPVSVLVYMALIITVIASIQYYKETLRDQGREQCEARMEAVEADFQIRIDNAVRQAVAEERKAWLKWHEAEVDRAVRQIEAEVQHDVIIKEIPTVVETAKCDNVGPDVLRLFNNAYRIGERKTPELSY